MNTELDQFQDVFIVESLEALDAMEAALLRLPQGNANSDIINIIFRVAHSIKGAAGMFGFTAIASFMHTLETLLDELRAERMQVSAQVSDLLLQSVDQIRMMVAATGKPARQHLAPPVLQDQIRQIVADGSRQTTAGQHSKAVARREASPSDSSRNLQATLAAAMSQGAVCRWRIRFTAYSVLLQRGDDPLPMLDELAGLGELIVSADCSQIPAVAALDPAQIHIQWEFLLATSASREAICGILERAGDAELSVEKMEAIEQATAPDASAEVMYVPPARSEVTIRVATGKLDELLNAVGEIVSTHSMLSKWATRHAGAQADQLRTGLSQLDANIRELQEAVMRVRMLPVGSLFSRFPRMVRDLSRRLGKQVRLQISGEQTELDKLVLEKIGDPLVHLVRNSVDHGIELPDIRLAAGKNPEGTVRMNAFRQGDAINIVISDDGRGLDKSRLLEEAQGKGLIDADAVLTDQQVYNMIFLPGFTTANWTTDVSGRGVGMDVVQQNIKELGGSVVLSTEPGKGTTTTIVLPLQPGPVDK